METRDFTITIGDPSRDGHGIHESTVVRIFSDDVSDEAVKKSVKEAGEAFCCDFSECLEADGQYGEEDCLKREVYEALLKSGLNLHPEGVKFFGLLRLKESDDLDGDPDENLDIGVSFATVLMAYVGFSLKNFSWEVVKAPKDIESVVKMPSTYGLMQYV